MTEQNMRTLLHIPILHTQIDMGSLGKSVETVAIQKMGKRQWELSRQAIEQAWTTIEQVVTQLEVPYDRVRLYQDGLPVCGREREIVTELAASGSRNHQILLRLMERGAILMGAESPELLVEEYRLVNSLLATQPAGGAVKATPEQQEQSRLLLQKRDSYIAQRINDTLQPGETGILFIGMLHSVYKMLSADIRIGYPLQAPSAAVS
jgi:hypothetical protein